MELGLYITKVPKNPLILYGWIMMKGAIIILNFIKKYASVRRYWSLKQNQDMWQYEMSLHSGFIKILNWLTLELHHLQQPAEIHKWNVQISDSSQLKVVMKDPSLFHNPNHSHLNDKFHKLDTMWSHEYLVNYIFLWLQYPSYKSKPSLPTKLVQCKVYTGLHNQLVPNTYIKNVGLHTVFMY
jgi:hypothetical protein